MTDSNDVKRRAAEQRQAFLERHGYPATVIPDIWVGQKGRRKIAMDTPRVQAGMRVGLTFEFRHKAIIREVTAVFYPLEGEPDAKVALALTSEDDTGKLEHDSSARVYRAVVRGHVRGDHAPGTYVCGFVGARTAGEGAI